MTLPVPQERFNKNYDAVAVVNCGEYGPTALRYYKSLAEPWWHRFLISRVKKHWEKYWPEIHKATVTRMEVYEQENWFGKKPFEIRVTRSGGWIPDDVMFELHFFDADGDYSFPIWVVAFKRYDVIHSQASF